MNRLTLKKYMALKISAAVILLVLVVVGFKIWGAMRAYNVENSELASDQERMRLLEMRVPYPSAENVALESEKLHDLLDLYNELNELARQGQITPPDNLDGIGFISLLEMSLRKINFTLAQAQVRCSRAYRFGFDRYVGGNPPDKRDVPRLARQLAMIEAITKMLGEAQVSELVALSREEFESASSTPEQQPPSNDRLAQPVHATEVFQLQFKGKEAAVLAFLNQVAGSPLFIVLDSLELSTPQPARRVAEDAAKTRAVTSDRHKKEDEEQPIFFGQELVEAKMNLLVYHFMPSLDFKNRDEH